MKKRRKIEAKATTKTVVKLTLKNSPMSEANTCIAEPNTVKD